MILPIIALSVRLASNRLLSLSLLLLLSLSRQSLILCLRVLTDSIVALPRASSSLSTNSHGSLRRHERLDERRLGLILSFILRQLHFLFLFFDLWLLHIRRLRNIGDLTLSFLGRERPIGGSRHKIVLLIKTRLDIIKSREQSGQHAESLFLELLGRRMRLGRLNRS